MKNTILQLFVVLVLMASPSFTYAEETKTYVGFGVGEGNLDVFDSGADKVDDSDGTFKIFGGTQVAENFYLKNIFLELGYIDFGEYSAHFTLFDETDTVEGGALYLALLGRVDFNNKVNLFYKVGASYWSMDIDSIVNIAPFTGSGSGNGIDIMYGFGASYNIVDEVSFILEWERYSDVADGVDISYAGVGSTELAGEDIDVISASLAYNF